MKTANVIAALAILVFASTALAQYERAVGPNPTSRAVSGRKGYLQVFTATQKSLSFASDDNHLFNLHTSYDIYDQSGRNVAFVPNHMSNMDEWPDQVALPPGNYRIVAQSTWCGLVTVTVMIQKGKTTLVHLDNNWFPSPKIPTNQLVFLPNGEAMGWSSTKANHSE